MLELPDLEVISTKLDRRFRNKTLEEIDVIFNSGLNTSIDKLKETLQGQDVKLITRVGKTLQIHFKSYDILELNLGCKTEIDPIHNKQNLILSLHFKGGDCISIIDFEKKATWILNPDKVLIPDVMSKEMDYEYLRTLLKSRNAQVREILLDQNLIRGIGSIYADKILWYAKISPDLNSFAISDKDIRTLYRTIKYVFLDAIKEAKRDYITYC